MSISEAVRAWGACAFFVWDEETPDELTVYGICVPVGADTGMPHGDKLPVGWGEKWALWSADYSTRLPKTRNDGTGEILGRYPDWVDWR